MFSRLCNLQNTVRNSHYFPDEEGEAERGQGTNARWLRQRLNAGLSKPASFSEAIVLYQGGEDALTTSKAAKSLGLLFLFICPSM